MSKTFITPLPQRLFVQLQHNRNVPVRREKNSRPPKKRAMMTGASLRAKKSAGVRTGRFFTLRSAQSIFGGVHAAAENKFKFLSPQGGET
ncbi:MAG TPA: hypothetical protein IAC18_01940 [Candidatus Scatomorpha merdipullorum]|uniref:Uncharacterized protein n=1 Tax=Candidatus Scatomorpha merdipullorum TaxID=2840927 RepID=A0A9D1FC11_9FIRM|nr:hypothetical protein [Candidatus Scatomorpha merdipullorum]